MITFLCSDINAHGGAQNRKWKWVPLTGSCSLIHPRTGKFKALEGTLSIAGLE